MLRNFDTPRNVEFISYTGKYPSLCEGVLTLKIKDTVYKFGKGFDSPLFGGVLPRFWFSGGECDNPANNPNKMVACVKQCEWIIDVRFLPDFLIPYAPEIDRVFNENVRHGCCGGCLTR